MNYPCSKRKKTKQHLFSDTAFSKNKNPNSGSICRRTCIQKVLPFAVSNGDFYLGQLHNCIRSHPPRKLCPYSQPWDSFTSAIWVKSVSVSISFKNAIKKDQAIFFSQNRKTVSAKLLYHLITIFRPCNSSNIFW